MQYTFTTEQSRVRANEIVDYIAGPRLWIPQYDYPEYDSWLNKVHSQLRVEDKQALIAIDERKIIGTIIFQLHKSNQAIEIKNISVRPEQQGRYIASFMLRNVEIEGERLYKVNKVVVDTKLRNLGIQSFLLKHSYLPTNVCDLYNKDAGLDVIYSKSIITRG